MPRLTQAQPRPDATPSFLSVAKAFYGPAFSPRRKSELAEAMADCQVVDVRQVLFETEQVLKLVN